MKEKHSTEKEPSYVLWMYLLFVLVTSFFTYVYHYDYPPSPFWDEPYHIASAEKYLSGVFFMEPHPPLGKLFIALGEKLLHPNSSTNQFITTDYARNFDAKFSFAGYRLFPTLFAWLCSVLFFFIFYFITRSSALSSILSFLYIFDNAEIVHSRAAMLDSTLSFFSLATILLFLLIQEREKKDFYRHLVLSILFGIAFACALTTKVVALVLILLVPAVVVLLWKQWQRIVIFLVVSATSFAMTYSGVWQIHFSLATNIQPELSEKGYYKASDAYKKILADKTTSTISAFPIMLRDSLQFVTKYSEGVPRLDLCKADENGSPAYFWPFGARTINYRWEKFGENATRYMYLVANPVSWALGLMGVFLSLVLLLSRLFGDRKEKLQHEFIMMTILGLYLGYMIAISQLTRVMYLYHYFLPLQFSFILFALAFINIRQIWKIRLRENAQLIFMTVIGLCIFASFQFFRPLSYYEPITNKSFLNRAVLPLWELTCVGCDKKSSIVVPRSE